MLFCFTSDTSGGCKFFAALESRHDEWKTHCYVGGAAQTRRCYFSIFLRHMRSAITLQFQTWLHVSRPFLSKPITLWWCTAEAWGLLTEKPQDIIWFHFHLNRFPLGDLILVSQCEPWPWISTGLQLVFNAHQSLMWESSPHSGVLLTQPSPSRPTLGPSGPSQVPNHTSVSTVAKLLQSDWHPSVGEHSYKKVHKA